MNLSFFLKKRYKTKLKVYQINKEEKEKEQKNNRCYMVRQADGVDERMLETEKVLQN